MTEAAQTLDLLDRTFRGMVKTGGTLGLSQLRALVLALIALKILVDDLASGDRKSTVTDIDRTRFDWSLAGSALYGRSRDVLSLARDVEDALPLTRDVFTLLLRDLDQLAERVLSDWLYWLGRLPLVDSGELKRALVLRWFDEKLDEDTTGWASGENGTPRSIARLMVKLAEFEQHERVLDPRAGNGALLAEAAASDQKPQLFGQESRPGLWAWALLRLGLANGPRAEIVCQDSVMAPAFAERDQLSRFGVVLCDVPFSSRSPSGVELGWQDPYGRFDRAPYERLSLESAFIQHAIASLDDKGRAVLLVTPGFLYRQGQDERLRRKLLQQRLLRAVIALPPKVYWPQTSIEPAIVVLDKFDDSNESQKGVTFVDAAQVTPKTRGRMVFSDDTIERIVASFRDATTDALHGIACQWVRTEELLKQDDLSLKPGHHARRQTDDRKMKFAQASSALEHANRQYSEASERFDALLRRLEDGGGQQEG